ncbi:hypothetical protein [Bradyrhizobium stylosanthis]|uniref:hypothetical protein n=1 Tax=Bradyrhizobium stylosanthis TaxID=1803665 RepID=UPI000ABF7C1A|nr:hypothetical protein [Bradyrhizobium stylosanthis]
MFQIHHILPQALAGHFTLKVLGDRFNLNGIRNLMDLPSNEQAARELGSSPHTGGHLGSYSRIFCKFLGVLQSHPSFAAAQEGDSAAVDQLDAELSSFLAAAKHALSKGHLLANTPLGMTKEDANKRIEDWYVNWKTYAEENRDSIKQMQDTVDQLHTASQWEGALRAPVLLPDSTLSLADKLAIIGRYTRGSPISQHFEAVGPVPHLPGFIHPVIDARLPSLIPPPLEGVDKPEGFAPSSPLLTYGLPGFPVPSPEWQRAMQLPPSTALPPEPQVLQFHTETGQPLTLLSDGSQVLGPPAPPDRGSALLMGAGVLGAGALMTPGLQGLGARILTGGVAAALSQPAFSANTSSATKAAGGSVFAKGAAPYNPFDSVRPADEPSAARPTTFADRFGSWIETPAGAAPAQTSNALGVPSTAAADAVAPDEVRRLTRVNEANAGSVFSSGSAPIPYLPSTEFNDRYGIWTVPTADGWPAQESRPMGVFADEPGYLIPPPIFGVDSSGNSHNEAEEWFSRWIRPLLRQD